jgi:endonuclease YncB( thermonuclease family)
MNISNTILITLFLFITILTGRVIRVIDGDTIVILTEDKELIKIRFDGIDCPESKQDFGSRAKQSTSDLCFGKEVRIEKSGEDRYGRSLGFVYVSDLCVNKELLKQGMAWHYRYFNKEPELEKLEANAKKAKIGLWSQPNPTPPWDFRRRK